MGGFYHWINFAILFAVLFVVIRKKLTQKFKEEREALKLEIDLSRAKYQQVKEEFENIKSLVANSDRAIEGIRQEASRSLVNELNRSRLEHQAMAERMTKDAEARLKAETERAKQVLSKELFEAAAKSAEESFKGQKAADDWALAYIQNETPRSRSNYAT